MNVVYALQYDPAHQILVPDGRRLSFDEHGDPCGKPLFLMHGTPGSRLFCHPDGFIARQLGLRLITVDRPGYGLSDPKPGRRLLDWPDDLAALADALGLRRFAVMGISGGGPFAAACAWKLPHRVTTAVLVSSPAPFDVPGITAGIKRTNLMLFKLAARAPWLVRLLLGAMTRSTTVDPDKALKQLASAFAACDLEVFREPGFLEAFLADSAEAFRSGPAGAALEMGLMGKPWGFRPEQIQVPVQLWHGDLDENAPIAMGRYMAAAIPRCRATFVTGQGHMLFYRRWREILWGVAV